MKVLVVESIAQWTAIFVVNIDSRNRGGRDQIFVRFRVNDSRRRRQKQRHAAGVVRFVKGLRVGADQEFDFVQRNEAKGTVIGAKILHRVVQRQVARVRIFGLQAIGVGQNVGLDVVQRAKANVENEFGVQHGNCMNACKNEKDIQCVKIRSDIQCILTYNIEKMQIRTSKNNTKQNKRVKITYLTD